MSNKLKIKKVALLTTLFSVATVASAVSTTIVPYANGTWAYDGTFNPDGTKGPVQAGYFVKDLSDFNTGPGASAAHQLKEVFAYGGDIELYSQADGSYLPSSFVLSYYPPMVFNKAKNSWAYWPNQMGDSGFRSVQDYAAVKVINPANNNKMLNIVDIDGRVDVADEASDYLNRLNTLDGVHGGQILDAQHFAQRVAAQLCADDNVDGVQFDIEPFNFNAPNLGAGKVPFPGQGQQYFYTEIAKDFAGYYGNATDPAGINTLTADPLHCVDAAHPNGRIFSVFTFSQQVTPTVASVFTHHNNGYIVDSLYDLGNTPGGTLNSPSDFATLAGKEIGMMKGIADKYDLPYQFAIPAGASAHEFEGMYDTTGKLIKQGYPQIEYVTAAFGALNTPGLDLSKDLNFKGIDVWGWSSAMWWVDTANTNAQMVSFEPAYPSKDKESKVIPFLQKNL